VGKKLVVGQGGLNFHAWIIIHRRLHGRMVVGEHNNLEKR
jgi:hypothetical protein